MARAATPGSLVVVPPEGRTNPWYFPDFFQFDRRQGRVRTAAGEEILWSPVDLLAGLQTALDREVGDASAEIQYRLGYQWGLELFKGLARRVATDQGVPTLEQMNFNVLLQVWRGPLSAMGWGTWDYDLRMIRQALPLVTLHHSCVAAARGPSDQPVCHLYAGLFAACFAYLAQHELVGVELECVATGHPECRFLVTSTSRAQRARQLRDHGVAAKEILDQLLLAPPNRHE